MNQGTARIVIIVVMVVVGAAVLMNGFGSSDTSATSSPSTSTSSSSTPPPSGSSSSPASSPTPPPKKSGVSIMALNGTTVPGLAAAAEDRLTSAGYKAPVAAENAPSTGVQKTVVYYRTGADEAQNKSDATYISKKFFKGSKVEKLGSSFDTIVPPNVTVVVVAGQDFANVIAAGG